MPFKIAVASGKGGTGKTSISVQLFHALGRVHPSFLVDCDVEEPNDGLFFPDAKIISTEIINQQVANINSENCTYCQKCIEYCEFNAITVIPPVEYTKIDPSLCHSCGACLYVCQDQAIFETDSELGKMKTYHIEAQNYLIEGLLKIGSPMQTSLIRSLKKLTPQNSSIIIYDAPPGTSCPVVETISESDYIVLVTEPTPFGLHDLKLTVELVKELDIPFGIIVNKAGLGFDKTHQYIKEKNIELLAEIPFSKTFASQYSKGELLKKGSHEFEDILSNLSIKLINKMNQHD
ncbi:MULTISPECIES: 4Fe-4S binding protein [unclassified Lentimicrobium]|uniref:nucleotide-binding protein n=1 Tax=unclassified Lentimicrobium TaxID=2677434 RepID=UPI001552556C|nr:MULTISPECIES: ATP-binding protein [unclassified Lentimicrobium]NPD46343.1 4Fe-4S binding protein [Lentimicrobium sp. S6]NPD85018.1 4Fe-4S binding protein [Lentimicrobium sp. L6]